MNGFTMQHTNFPFVCAIVDDASTDGEPEVIKNYLNEYFDLEDKDIVQHEETEDYVLTLARHKANLNCYFAVFYLKYNHYSIKKSKLPYLKKWSEHVKYHAFCEGDDYWIMPNKLQRQVSFLEENPDFSICFTGANMIVEGLSSRYSFNLFNSLENREYKGGEVLRKWIIPTASIVYKNVGEDMPKDNRFIATDIVIELFLLQYGRCYCINDKTMVYRRNSGGASIRNLALSCEKQINHFDALCEYFGYHKEINEIKAEIYLKYAFSQISISHFFKFITMGLSSEGVKWNMIKYFPRAFARFIKGRIMN